MGGGRRVGAGVNVVCARRVGRIFACVVSGFDSMAMPKFGRGGGWETSARGLVVVILHVGRRGSSLRQSFPCPRKGTSLSFSVHTVFSLFWDHRCGGHEVLSMADGRVWCRKVSSVTGFLAKIGGGYVVGACWRAVPALDS